MVTLKRPEEIEKIRTSNIIVAEILNELRGIVKPGITTKELDLYAEELAKKRRRSRLSKVTMVILLRYARPLTAWWCMGCLRTKWSFPVIS